MATRFYLPHSLHRLTPAYAGGWTTTAGATRHSMQTVKMSEALASVPTPVGGYTGERSMMSRQYISDPLSGSGTITGTIKGQLRCQSPSITYDYCLAIVAKVVSGDGATLRGTLLTLIPSSLQSEWATTLINRNFPVSTSVAEVAFQDGDRIVIELGAKAFATGWYTNWYIRYGDSSGSDLPENETGTDDYCPWVELSQTLSFIKEQFVSQAVAQVETRSSYYEVAQLIAQVEYTALPAGTYIYAGNIAIGVTPSSTNIRDFTKTGAVSIAVNPAAESYLYQAPFQYVYIGNISVAVMPSSVTIHDRLYTGNVQIGVMPSADILVPDRFYQGDIGIEIVPLAATRIPIPGFDNDTGYGLVDFTDLDQPPPFWCIDTDGVLIALDNTAQKFELYAEYSWEATGGAELAGACTFAVVDPGVDDYTTIGGAKVSGSFNIEVPEPWITTFTTKGGALVQGALGITLITPSTRLITEITTEGGVVIGGTPTHTSVDPSVLVTTVNLQGGAVVGGYRYPPFEFVDPDTDEVYYEFTARGTVYVGGNLEFDIPEAPAYEFSSRRGGAQVGGDCTFGFWQPPVTEFDLLGGVFIEGSIVEDIELYETYTLTGQGFQPSIYSGFNFNSYAERNGQVLAARSDGIYVLEGADDAGQKIRPGVRLGPTNFGVDNLKGVRAIYPGDCGPDAAARVFCPTKGQEGFYALDRGRFSVGYEILDRLLVIEITDFEQLSHLEILPRMRTKGQG